MFASFVIVKVTLKISRSRSLEQKFEWPSVVLCVCVCVYVSVCRVRFLGVSFNLKWLCRLD